MQLIYIKIQYLTDKKEFIEFSLNVSTEFSDKIFVITVKGLERNLLLSHLLCEKPECYHSTSKTHVRDRIFKLSSIHASVIYQIPWIRWIQWNPVVLRENKDDEQNSYILVFVFYYQQNFLLTTSDPNSLSPPRGYRTF